MGGLSAHRTLGSAGSTSSRYFRLLRSRSISVGDSFTRAREEVDVTLATSCDDAACVPTIELELEPEGTWEDVERGGEDVENSRRESSTSMVAAPLSEEVCG